MKLPLPFRGRFGSALQRLQALCGSTPSSSPLASSSKDLLSASLAEEMAQCSCIAEASAMMQLALARSNVVPAQQPGSQALAGCMQAEAHSAVVAMVYEAWTTYAACAKAHCEGLPNQRCLYRSRISLSLWWLSCEREQARALRIPFCLELLHCRPHDFVRLCCIL